MALCPVLDAVQAELHAGGPVLIRRAALTDIAALIDFKRTMAIADGVESMFDAGPADWAQDGIGPAARFVTLVAELSAEVVGMAIFNEQPFAGMAAPAFYLQDLFVRADCRRRGIGRRLLTQVAVEARIRGARLIYLNVRADNPARRLYDDLNFAQAKNCLVYVLIGGALDEMAGGGMPHSTLG